MAAVLGTNITSICKTYTSPVFVSPVIQSFAAYYKSLSTPSDVIWSMMLGTPLSFDTRNTDQDATQAAGFMVFGPLSVTCMQPVFTPMVASLPTAPGLGGTPYQYYVVQVEYCAIGKTADAISTYTKFPNFPKYLLVDSGTTLCLLPGMDAASTCASINGVASDEMVILVLKNNVTITYQSTDVSYQAPAGTGSDTSRENVFSAMDDGTASNFSVKNADGNFDVGILGCTALRNLYVEFNLTQKTIGFGQVRK